MSLGVAEKALPPAVHHASIAGVQLHRSRPGDRWHGEPGPHLALVGPGVTGERHLGTGFKRVYRLSALSGVALGEETRHRHLHEIGVAKVVVSIGEGELYGLDQSVDILRGVMAHALEVKPLQ